MGGVPLGLTEALGALMFSHEGPLLDAERSLLGRTYRPLAKRTAIGAILVGVAIILMVTTYRLPSEILFLLSFVLLATGFILMFGAREFWHLHQAMRTHTFRVYGADMPSAKGERRPGQIIARPNGTPVFVFGHIATASERESLGRKVVLAEFLSVEGSRPLTAEECWELSWRVAQFKSSFFMATVMVTATFLIVAGYGEKIGLDGVVLVCLVPSTLGVLRVAFRAARVVPRLKRDLKLGQIVVDPDGTQRLAASGTIWTDNGRQASWRRNAFSSKSPISLFSIGGMPPVSTVRQIEP